MPVAFQLQVIFVELKERVAHIHVIPVSKNLPPYLAI